MCSSQGCLGVKAEATHSTNYVSVKMDDSLWRAKEPIAELIAVFANNLLNYCSNESINCLVMYRVDKTSFFLKIVFLS